MISSVIDKQPWLSFKESSSAVVALISTYFIFDLEYTRDCAGACYFIQDTSERKFNTEFTYNARKKSDKISEL